MAKKGSGKAGELFGKPSGSPASSPSQPSGKVGVIDFWVNQGETWRCERPDRIAAMLPGFVPAADSVARIVEMVSPHPQMWSYLRKVWGVVPMFPGPEEPEENLRVWSEMEAVGALALSRDGVAALVDSVRGLWMASTRASAPVAAAPENKGPVKEELDLDGEKSAELMRDLGLSGLRFENHDEELWFQKRVSELRKLLEVTGTKMLGKQLILTELELRRADVKAFSAGLEKDELRDARTNRRELHAKFLELTTKIEQVADWFFSVNGINFKNCLSEVITGYQEFARSEDSKLLDGIFTATEIKVLHRHSAQSLDQAMSPAPVQYRAGLVAHLNAARSGVLTPGWKSGLSDAELARVDRAYCAAIAAVIKESGAEIPDLLHGGEYPKINENTPNTGANHVG